MRLAALLLAVTLATPAAALRDTAEEVRFATGLDHVTIMNTITTGQAKTYLFDARAGQTMSVDLASDLGATFVVVAPDGSPLFNGLMADGTTFTGPLPVSGPTAVRVTADLGSAPPGRTGAFTLRVAITE